MKSEYDSIVQEVEEGMSFIKKADPEYDYMQAVKKGDFNTMTLPKDVASLTVPLSVFSTYTVRDAVIAKAMQDEQFAFVLVNKIAGAVYDNADNVTQHEMEALAVVANVTCMWEQFNHALTTLTTIGNIHEENKLEIPPLAQLTLMLMEKYETFPFDNAREGTLKLLIDLEKELNTNSEGE